MAAHRDAGMKAKPANKQILFWAPQLVGYVRLTLLIAALVSGQRAPLLTYCLYLTNFLLDGLDGMLARAFNQVSQFGAWFDVAVDCLCRGTLWASAVDGPWSAFPILLETLTFVCTHKGGGAAWKEGCFSSAPAWAAAVMASGFKTAPGALAIAGLMGMPLWVYARKWLPGTLFATPLLGVVLVVGRLLCAAVEGWVLCRHLDSLLRADCVA